jgi:hypothetical protein
MSQPKSLTSCSICLEDIDPTKGSATMMCGHQFHYNCIFKWNFTQQGDTCPLCRDDLQLPHDVDTSHGIEEEDNIITETREIINIASVPGEVSINQQKKMLSKLLDVTGRQDMGISITCNSCSHSMHSCDFCSRPFCACRDTNGKAHFPTNPFNKFYNTLFDHRVRDDDMIRVVEIVNPFGEDLFAARVCGCCFNNRDIVLGQTMQAVSDGEFTETLFDKSEIKLLYYSLFYDNSGASNISLRELMPSYDTYSKFKSYVMRKYGITPIARMRSSQSFSPSERPSSILAEEPEINLLPPPAMFLGNDEDDETLLGAVNV